MDTDGPRSPPGDDLMIAYRSFLNTDPPRIRDLWHACQLGRGAADKVTTDAFELVIFGQSYFDRDSCLLAVDGQRVVGMVLAGFGTNQNQSGLDRGRGVICAVLVLPEYRRQGIGRALVERGSQMLRQQGAEQIVAGGAPGSNPFMVGLYGGSQPAGFLTSDPDADPFFRSLGFHELERHDVYTRNLAITRDPMHFRLIQNRRKFQLSIIGEPPVSSWWWATRFGRLDTLRFLLEPKGESGGPAVAGLTVVGLDLYIPKWRQRSVGVIDLYVPKQYRKQGFAQTLLVEVCKRLKDELVTLIEIHTPSDNDAMKKTLASCSFEAVDQGVVYESPS